MELPEKTDSSDNETFPPLISLQRLAISENGFVFDPVRGHNFTVNETGLVILRMLQKDNQLAPLLDNLMCEYDAPRRELERDVVEFAGLLRDYVGE